MKKILTLGLALIMVVLAFASCNRPGEGEASSTPKEAIPTPPPVESSTPLETPEETPDESASETEPPVEEIVFEDCDEAVYVVGTEGGLKLRTTTSFDSEVNVAEIVDPGTELRRIGVHETWSKVVYENKEYFTSSRYLSTEKEPVDTEVDGKIVFEEVDETVYVNTGYEDGQVNIYSKPNKNAPITDMALPTEGTELKRTGIAYDTENDPEGLGWSRVIYNGKECYIRNSQLAVKKAEAETPAQTSAETPADTTPDATPEA